MSELFDFLNEKKTEEEGFQADWEQVKKDWIIQLELFMTNIKDWLSVKESEGVIDLTQEKIVITEEHLGSYEAPRLILRIGTNEVKVEPIGRLIIGATGRIDIISFADSIIILNDSKRGWIYRESIQSKRYKDLDEESFAEILKDLLYEN